MPPINPNLTNFTGGLIGELLQGRVDISSYPAGAAVMRNFWPIAQGPMGRRPGLLFVGEHDDHNTRSYLLSFIYDLEQNYLLVGRDGEFKFYIDDHALELPNVSTAFANGTFSSFTGWSDESTGSADAGVSGGQLWLDSDGAGTAIARTTLTVSGGDANKVHVVDFDVIHGPINLRIGSSAGGKDLADYQDLRTGAHQLAFTPLSSGTVHVDLWHRDDAGRAIDNISIRSAGAYSIEHPYTLEELAQVQSVQIGDVLYLVHGNHPPRRLERRSHYSWSLTYFEPDDGPFDTQNLTPIQLRASNTHGEVTLTASESLFTADDVRRIYSITSQGQSAFLAARDDHKFTGHVKIAGKGATSRTFRVDITGTFSATINLQRSSGNTTDFADMSGEAAWTAPDASTIDDSSENDNETWYYRLAINQGNYTSGTVNMKVSTGQGSQTGIVRIISVTNSTTAVAEVIQQLADTEFSEVWRAGAWNAVDGYPSTIAYAYGRLWLGRGLQVWSSKSDDFTSFEAGTEDDQSIAVTLATPSSDAIQWMNATAHLIIGTRANEIIGVPNTASEPTGPTNFQTQISAYEGGAPVRTVAVAGSVVFAHRTLRKLMQFTQDPQALSDTTYVSIDLTRLAPELALDEIVTMAVQREPERRIYVVLKSGRCIVLLFRREEDIVAWAELETDGHFEDVQVLPQPREDRVYFSIRRMVDGSTRRFIERLASETVLNNEDFVHLDCCLQSEISRPPASVDVSGRTGAITITADDDVFAQGDVGKIIWLCGGRAEIMSRVNTREVTANVIFELSSTDRVPPGRWGMANEFDTFSGLDHLDGATVQIWGDGAFLGTAVVVNGGITLPTACSRVVAGLKFRSRYQSLKLSYGAARGTALNQMKAIKSLGILYYRTGEGVKVGPAWDKLYPIPLRKNSTPMGMAAPLFTGEEHYDFGGGYGIDERLCLEVDGPAPCTIVGLVPHIEEFDR